MKKFFESYQNEVRKPTMNWYKNHWKGVVGLNAGILAIEAVGFVTIPKIYQKIQEKKLKRKNNEFVSTED